MDVLKKPKIFIDHIDRNGLNNMRSNLRFTTVALNACNTRFLSKSKSGYRGVYLYRNGYMVGQYTACILVKRNKIFGGYFPTAIEAAKKYNELALKYHGEFARLNPI